jgi:prepilin-type N-terminal cleavage/methylation domain-containing protein
LTAALAARTRAAGAPQEADAMKRERCRTARTRRGFTLVELLLVMGIIVLLVGLLLPAVTAAIVVARVASTENVIKNLGVGLESFKGDWGVYPPSGYSYSAPEFNATPPNQCGYNLLAFYLMGPDGKGWGAGYRRQAPFITGALATGAYGPYYTPEQSGIYYTVLDSFRPAKEIFYYRFEPGRSSAYDVSDNNTTGSTAVDSSSITNFAGQTQLELLAKPQVLIASGSARYWVREDYLLISSGADRLWGYVKDDGSGKMVAATAVGDATGGQFLCDDICNFKR